MAENAKNLREINKLLKDAVGLTNEQKESYRQLAQGIKEGSNASKEFETLQKNILRDIKEASRAVYEVRDAFAASVDELKGMNSGLSRTKKAFQGLESISDKLVEDASGRNRLSLKQLKNIENQVKQKLVELKLANDLNKRALEENKLALDNLGTSKKDQKQKEKLEKENKKITSAIKATNQELFKTEGLNEDLIKQAKIRIAQEEEINKKLGATPAILEGIGKALQKIGLPDFGISDSVAEAKELLRVRSDELKLEGKKLSTSEALSTVTGQVFKGIGKQLSFSNLLQGSFTLLVSSMMQLDKSTGELAKNIGVSYDESLALQKNFNQIAIDSDNIMVSSTALNKSFASLNQQFQGTTNFSKETLESFTALTAQAGISEETVGNIAKLTGAQGNEINDNIALLQGELGAMNAVNKTSFSTKQMLEDIGKINKSTLLILNQQPQALAKTLYTSRKLGLSFAEMEGISSSLLDFESSIQSELEAELLTGKNLNLEKARQFALEGNIGKAAEEVAKQVGSAAEFGEMNVIQQEAMAKAVGLTKDQLANSLIEQEAIANLSKFEGDTAKEKFESAVALLGEEEARRQLGNDILADQMKSQSVQERFGAAVERMKEIFLEVGTALMPIVSAITDMVVGIAKFVANFGPLIKFLGIAYGIFKGIQATMKVMKFLGNDIYRNQILGNAAAKVGLITEEQNVLAQRAQAMQGNKINNMKKMKNLYEKQSLFNVIQEGIQQKVNAVTERVREGLAKGKLALQKLFNLQLIREGLLQLKNWVKSAAGFLMDVGKLALNAAISIAKIPVIGPILAIGAAASAGAAGYALYSRYAKKPAGDVMGDADGRTQISPKEGGIFELSKKDDFIAAPGLLDKKENKREGRRAERTGENSQKIIDLLTTQNNFLKTIAAKSTSIIMNGNEVGQGINTSERAIQ